MDPGPSFHNLPRRSASIELTLAPPPLPSQSSPEKEGIPLKSLLSMTTIEPEIGEGDDDNLSDASGETPHSSPSPSLISAAGISSAPTTTSGGQDSSQGDVASSNGDGKAPHGKSSRLARASDIANWAPMRQNPLPSGMPQLPDLLPSTTLTSLNIAYVSPMQREMEQSINSLLSEKVFEELMKDSLGRHRFREFLVNTNGDLASLDLWCDLRAYKSQTDKVKTTALALHELFTQPAGTHRGAISTELREDILTSLRQGVLVGDTLEQPARELLSVLYRNEFNSFIKHKLIENASVRLGQVGLTDEEKKGLGDAFCLTNPRLKDHPIVLVSPGFERLTGYQARFITGRNCRMLAGPATSQLTTQRISTALRRGEGINTLILNYRSNGVPFWNLLNIIPLRASNSSDVTYFIGGQTEVSGILAQGNHLSYLVGSENDPSPPIDPSEDFSPSLRSISAGIAMGGGSLPSLFKTATQTSVGGGPLAPPPLAGGQAKVGRSNQFQGTVEKKGFKGFLQAVSGGSFRRRETPIQGEDQQFAGAEAMFDKEAKPVELQLAAFAEVYNKVIIFRRVNREIIFVTGAFLAFCGLPYSQPGDAYRSMLLHADLLSFIGPPNEGDGKAYKKRIKDAISKGISLSIEVEVKMHSKKKTMYDVGGKKGVLHLTPLGDRDGTVEAMVAIFG